MMLKNGIHKIMIPRFDTIGDIILLEGFLEALLNKYSDAEIVLVVQESYAQLKSLFPEHIKWFTTDINPYSVPDKDSINLLLKSLAAEKWDLIITSTFNRTYLDETIALKFKDVRNIAIGADRQIPWRLKHLWKTLGLIEERPTYEFVPVDEFAHENEKYQSLWRSLTGEEGPDLPRLVIAPALTAHANDLLLQCKLQKDSFFICNPAGIANITIKQWPEERFADIIVWIEKEYAHRTLVTGHEKEKGIIERVLNIAREKGATPVGWLGKDGEIPILAALTQKATLFFGNDTGPMHIAAALGVPTLGIFGGGNWPRFLPVGPNSIGIAGDLPCFGCNWNCIFGDAPCVKLVNANDVQIAIKLVLSGGKLDGNILHASALVSDETRIYIAKARDTYKICEVDRAARLDGLQQLNSLMQQVTSRLADSEADRAARLEIINRVNEQLDICEKDRAARLDVINALDAQVKELQRKLGNPGL